MNIIQKSKNLVKSLFGSQNESPTLVCNLPNVFNKHKDLSEFSEFKTEDGVTIPLFIGGRDLVKGSWRQWGWYLDGIYRINAIDPDNSAIASIVREMDSADTWLQPVEEYVSLFQKEVSKYEEHFKRSEVICKETGEEIISYKQSSNELERIANSYLQNAKKYRNILYKYLDDSCSNISILETGCGMGYEITAHANDPRVKFAMGIDIITNDPRTVYQQHKVNEFLGFQNVSNKIKIQTQSIQTSDIEENSFDLIHSTSVIEHINEVSVAFKEMYRLLKPGGFMIHNFDHFYGFTGGHALCSLDYPWGHAMISEIDFKRYLDTYRPNEKKRAWKFYSEEFNHPRLSLSQIQYHLVSAGFEILEWNANLSDKIPTQDILNRAMVLNSNLSIWDLSSKKYYFVARKLDPDNRSF